VDSACDWAAASIAVRTFFHSDFLCNESNCSNTIMQVTDHLLQKLQNCPKTNICNEIKWFIYMWSPQPIVATRVGRAWVQFSCPTQPDPQVKWPWPKPTRPKINIKLWTRPSSTHIARLSVVDNCLSWSAPRACRHSCTIRQKKRPNNRNGINK